MTIIIGSREEEEAKVGAQWWLVGSGSGVGSAASKSKRELGYLICFILV